MEQATEIFTYSSELLDGDSIRLIDIEPNGENAIIRCKLSSFKRANVHEYKALSYAWGDTAKTCSILVNGKAFWLHKNLWEALHHIRSEAHTIRLWTDRICIDQDNIPERNSQVRNMGKTYAGAEEVLVWLGAVPAGFGSLTDLHDIVKYQYDLMGHDWEVKWQLLIKILSLPWFERLWVIQEVALARKATVLLGYQRCDIEVLLELIEIDLARIGYLAGKEDLKIAGIDSIGTAIDGLFSMTHLRDLLTQDEKSFSQCGLVYQCRGQRCHDPRDYVFSTIGVAEHMGVYFQEVDYHLTPDEVFLRFSKEQLMKDANELLYCDGLTAQLDLPSWAQDPSVRPDSAPFVTSAQFPAEGVGWSSCFDEQSFIFNSRVLVLPGSVVDEVVLSRGHGHDATWSPSTLKACEREYVTASGTASPYGGYLGQLQAFRRTVVAGTCINPHSSEFNAIEWPGDNDTAYEVYVGRAEPLWSLRTFAYSLDSKLAFTMDFGISFTNVCYGRAIVLTKSGRFGVGPREAKVADLIVTVPGVRMPLLLRPVADSDRYKILGPAYVHGLMKGEPTTSLTGRLNSGEAKIYHVE